MPVRTISVLGGILQGLTTVTDRLPDDGETISTSMFFMQPAGKGSSSAVAAYRLTRPNPKNSRQTHEEAVEDEIHVRMVGAVSDDDQFGHPLVQNLADCGVNTDGVVFIKGKRTGVANILVEAPSGAKRVMEHLGAATALEPSDFMTLESLGGGVAPDLVIAQLEMRRVTIERAIETAHRENVEVLLKPSPPRVLMPEIYPMISHLVMNETEAAMLSECTPDEIENQTGLASVADYFLELGVKNVVVTLGEKGAYYANKSGHGHVEAEKNCTVIDTSGAGDSFVGAYAAQYILQKQQGPWDIKAAVQYGCKASARIIECMGCLEPIVWADEVDIPQHREN